jgi:hypothetical protein
VIEAILDFGFLILAGRNEKAEMADDLIPEDSTRLEEAPCRMSRLKKSKAFSSLHCPESPNIGYQHTFDTSTDGEQPILTSQKGDTLKR